MKFYLGTHVVNHIGKTTAPLFVSVRQLKKRKHKPFKQTGPVCVDSGGFSELSMFGKWETTPQEYAAELLRLKNHLGLEIEWASCQDWMVEPVMIKKTGLTIKEHQKRTVDNYLLMLGLMKGTGVDIIPVIQGQTVRQYLSHVREYNKRGVQLDKVKTVGVGSVCRRENSEEVGEIVKALFTEGLSLHAFGVKKRGLVRYGKLLQSADSLAWSFGARYSQAHCSHHQKKPTTKNCANCLTYALEWRAKLLSAYGTTS